jgi:hypothetical protein
MGLALMMWPLVFLYSSSFSDLRIFSHYIKDGLPASINQNIGRGIDHSLSFSTFNRVLVESKTAHRIFFGISEFSVNRGSKRFLRELI